MTDRVEHYRQLIHDYEREQRQRSLFNLHDASNTTPEREARRQKISDGAGVPLFDEEETLRQEEQRQRLRSYEQLLENSPRLQSWLQEQRNARIAQDDLDNLSFIERTFGSASSGWQRGNDVDELGRLGFLMMTQGGLTQEQMLRRDELSRRMKMSQARQDAAGLGQTIIGNTFELAGQMVQGLKAAVAPAVTAGSAAAIAGFAGPQAALPEEIVTVPAAAVAGAAFGLVHHSWQVEAGHAYLEYMELRDVTGREVMDENVAFGAAALVGTVNAALEMTGLKLVAKGTGLERLINRFTRKEVGQQLEKLTVREAAKRAAKGWAKAYGGEVSTEVAQEAVTMLSGELAKMVDNNEFASMDIEEFTVRMLGILEKVGTGMLLPAGIGSGGRFVVDATRASKARSNEKVFEAMGETSAASKVRERLPARFQDFVEHVTRDGPVQEVYIEAERFRDYFQSAGLTLEDVAQTVPSVAAQRDAFDNGGDLHIPIGEYAAHLAGTEHHQGLAPHLRLRAEDMSAVEADLFEANYGAEFRAEFESALADSESLIQSEAPVDQIYQDVRGQLLNAGVAPDVADTQAALYRAFYKSVAGEGTGVDALDLYRSHQLQVRSALSPEDTGAPAVPRVALDQLTVASEARSDDTGEVVTVARPAQEVVAETQARRERLSTLLDCLAQ